MSRNTRLSVDSYNRIFILGGKTLSTDRLRSSFEQFGAITDVRMLKDSVTRENKGINYITFEKASEAALAIEKMNGQLIEGLTKPIKVVLANDRSEGNVRDPDEEDKMKRLFIVVPEGQAEDDLRNNFGKFGDVDYIKMLKKNERGMQLAYVKFHSAYHAALALEECDLEYKAVFAETAWSTKRMKYGRFRREDSGMDAPLRKKMREDYEGETGFRGHRSSSVSGRITPHLSHDQVHKLFDLLPGFQSLNYDPPTGSVHASYSNPSVAANAIEKLNSFEYPPGCPIHIHFSEPQISESSIEMSYNRPHFLGSSVESNFKTLVETIEKATALIQNSSFALNNFASSYESDKSERLSSALVNAPVVRKLSFTTSPDMPPINVLVGIFSDFGNLVDVEVVPGKNYGYASFASYESANQAMKSINDQVICGNLFKVRCANSSPSLAMPGAWRSGFLEDASRGNM